MDNQLNCADQTNASKIANAAYKALENQLHNPYRIPKALTGVAWGYIPDCDNKWRPGQMFMYFSISEVLIYNCTELGGEMIFNTVPIMK